MSAAMSACRILPVLSLLLALVAASPLQAQPEDAASPAPAGEPAAQDGAQAERDAQADALVRDYPGLDPLPLATLLLSDGHGDRAAGVLDRIDLERAARDRRFDWARYHTLRALIAQGDDDTDAAIAAFEAAIDASDAIVAARAAGERPRGEDPGFGTVDDLVYLYLAQAHFNRDRHRAAIAVLERAGDRLDGLPGAWNLRAHSHWLAGEQQQAFDVLARAGARFPANTSFLRRTVFYLVEAGLFQEAARVGAACLAQAQAGAADYLAIGTALRRSGALDESIALLEAGRLRHPDDDGLAKALAQALLDRGRPLAAAEVLAPVAERDPSLTAEAAELFRRAGHHQRALNLNARVPETGRRLKQRVGLLLQQRRYDLVAGMEEALARARLLADEDIRYALAYALFRDGRHEEAERHLATLTRAELFRKSTELRRLMAECAEERWKCA